jgi:GNAT superfamily N-acetyltransferase
MTVLYRRTGPEDTPQVCSFWKQHWGSDFMVVHGSVFRPDQLEGFVAEDGGQWLGLLTYRIEGIGCEVISLDSLRAGQGIGTRLIQQVASEARRAGCARLFLSTTNDNLEALSFYQKRGFRLAAIRPGAVDRAREIKPAISLIGLHGIPLRDEIDLELTLG